MATRLQHFDSIDEVLALLRADMPTNPFFRVGAGEYMWATDGPRIRLLPALFHPFIFRGQTERHCPCVPSVFRGVLSGRHPAELQPIDHAKFFKRRVQLEEFLCALESHPAIAIAVEMSLVTHPEAIAQHYEMATDLLDLSQDLEVAAFFATNIRDAGDDWHPIESGTGVLYRLALPANALTLPEPFHWIGAQLLPRPGEQRAWALRLPLGLDFEALPVDIFTFTHCVESGQELADRFDGGRLLFPSDTLAQVANSIRSAPSISRILFDRMLASSTGLDRAKVDCLKQYFESSPNIVIEDREMLSLSPSQSAIAREAARQRADIMTGAVLAVRRRVGTS